MHTYIHIFSLLDSPLPKPWRKCVYIVYACVYLCMKVAAYRLHLSILLHDERQTNDWPSFLRLYINSMPKYFRFVHIEQILEHIWDCFHGLFQFSRMQERKICPSQYGIIYVYIYKYIYIYIYIYKYIHTCTRIHS